jgi:sec-independent protein translocase protein TatA
MPSLGPAEVLVILVLALLIFGPQKMPEIGRQVGRAMREFRKAQSAVRTELRDAFDITGGAVTGTNAPPPSYGTPAPTAPPEPASADAPANAPADAATAPANTPTTPASPSTDAAPTAPATPAAPVAEAALADDDPAAGRGLGAASRPAPASRASNPGADDDDPAFGRRAGTPVEPR